MNFKRKWLQIGLTVLCLSSLQFFIPSANAQLGWTLVFGSPVCDSNGNNTLGGDSNCAGDDLTFKYKNGSWALNYSFSNPDHLYFVPFIPFPAPNDPGLGLISGIQVKFMAQSVETNCNIGVMIAGQANSQISIGNGLLLAQAAVRSQQPGIFTFEVSETIGNNGFDGFNGVDIAFDRGTCAGPFFIDEIQVSIVRKQPTPTPTGTSTGTSTATPTNAMLCATKTPVPRATTCSPGPVQTDIIASGSWQITNGKSFIIPVNFVYQGTPGGASMAFQAVWANGNCSANYGLSAVNSAGNAVPLVIGQTVNYLKLGCGATRYGLATQLTYSYRSTVCVAPVNTSVPGCIFSTATPPPPIPSSTNTTTPTSSATTIPKTATAQAAGTAISDQHKTATAQSGTSIPKTATAQAGATQIAGGQQTATAGAQATKTVEGAATSTARASQTAEASATHGAQTATAAATNPPLITPCPGGCGYWTEPPKVCDDTRYQWDGDTSKPGVVPVTLPHYNVISPYYDPACTEYVTNNIGMDIYVCPSGYVPSDLKCNNQSTPVPGGGTGTPGGNATAGPGDLPGQDGAPGNAPGPGAVSTPNGQGRLATPKFATPGGGLTPVPGLTVAPGGGLTPAPGVTVAIGGGLTSSLTVTVAIGTPALNTSPVPTANIQVTAIVLITASKVTSVCISWLPPAGYFDHDNQFPKWKAYPPANYPNYSLPMTWAGDLMNYPVFGWPMAWAGDLMNYPVFDWPMAWAGNLMNYPVYAGWPVWSDPAVAQYPTWQGFPALVAPVWSPPANPGGGDWWLASIINSISYYVGYASALILYYGGYLVAAIVWVVSCIVVIIFYLIAYLVATLYDYFGYVLWVVWWAVSGFGALVFFVLSYIIALFVNLVLKPFLFLIINGFYLIGYVVAYLIAILGNWVLKPFLFLIVNGFYLIGYVVAYLIAILGNWILKPLLFLIINGFYLAGYYLATMLVFLCNLFSPLYDFLAYIFSVVIWFLSELFFTVRSFPELLYITGGYFLCNFGALLEAIKNFFSSIYDVIVAFKTSLTAMYCSTISAGGSPSSFFCLIPPKVERGLSDLWGCKFTDIQLLMRNALTSSYYINYLWKFACFMYSLRIVRDGLQDILFIPRLGGGGDSSGGDGGDAGGDSGGTGAWYDDVRDNPNIHF